MLPELGAIIVRGLFWAMVVEAIWRESEGAREREGDGASGRWGERAREQRGDLAIWREGERALRRRGVGGDDEMIRRLSERAIRQSMMKGKGDEDEEMINN